jgi:hypothetical protein
MRIRVRIDPPYPPVCLKRRLNGGGLSDETGKNKGPVSQQVWHDRDPSSSKALSAEHRPKFYSTSPAMMTSPYICQKSLSET